MRFVAALAVAAFGLTACSADEDALQERTEAAEVEVAPEPDPEPQADEVERRPSAEERREATLERQRQEREAQQESQPEAGRDVEPPDLLTAEAATSDLSSFGAAGDRLTLLFSSELSARSVPIVRFGTITPIECTYRWVECLIDGAAVTMTWSEASSFRRDLADASVIDVLNATGVSGKPVRVSAPVPVSDQRLSPLPELTRRAAQQALADVARRLAVAWRDGAEDYAELDEAVAAAAQDLLQSHAPLAGDFDTHDWQHEVIWLSEVGVSELGGDWFPAANFTAFSAIGIPGVPATIFGGAHTVGDEWAPDVAVPGTYVAFDVEGCYWERLDNTGSIIANNFIRAAPRVEVTITSSDFAFNSERCGRWTQIDF